MAALGGRTSETDGKEAVFDMSNQAFAESMQQARDLRNQLNDLERDDEKTVLFEEHSPGRRMVRLWSLVDGMEIEIPRYMVMGAITKRQANGNYVFTANKDEAPKFRDGSVKCFLADGSTERETGLLDEAGLSHLAPCPANKLRSTYSKRIHAMNRHPQSWATLQEFVTTQEREESRDEQRKQTAAILELAGGAARAVEAPSEGASAAEKRQWPGRPGRPRKET